MAACRGHIRRLAATPQGTTSALVVDENDDSTHLLRTYPCNELVCVLLTKSEVRYALLSSVKINGITAQAMNARIAQGKLLDSLTDAVGSVCGNITSAPVSEPAGPRCTELASHTKIAILALFNSEQKRHTFVLQNCSNLLPRL